MLQKIWVGKECAAVMHDEDNPGSFLAVPCCIVSIKIRASHHRCIAEVQGGCFISVYDYDLYQTVTGAEREAKRRTRYAAQVKEGEGKA